MERKWSFWHTAGVFLLAGLIILTGLLLVPHSRVLAWIIFDLILSALLMIIGHGITSIWKGALIDENNRVGLSRFQMACWTIIVLSTFLSAVFLNVEYCPDRILDITIPDGLWILMGISTTSLVGSPLLSSGRKAKGFIVVNPKMENASFSDMFRGEEVSNYRNPDLAKIQMFYFTAITLVVYAAAVIGYLFKISGCAGSLPAISNTMAILLGISNAGYLANKAVPRSGSDAKEAPISSKREP